MQRGNKEEVHGTARRDIKKRETKVKKVTKAHVEPGKFKSTKVETKEKRGWDLEYNEQKFNEDEELPVGAPNRV